jgi:hypothetical protein
MPSTGGPFAVVLVAPEIFGNNHYMKDICRRLAKAGYFAIAPDVYARKADLTKFTNIADMMPIVNNKPDPEMMSDFDSAVDYAKSSGKADTPDKSTSFAAVDAPRSCTPRTIRSSRRRASAGHNSRRPDAGIDGLVARSGAGARQRTKDTGIRRQPGRFFAALKARGTSGWRCIQTGHGFSISRPDNIARPIRRRVEADARGSEYVCEPGAGAPRA